MKRALKLSDRPAVTVLRAVLFPVFAVAVLLLYTRALEFLTDALPSPRGHAIYLVLIVQGFLAASAVALAFAYPLALFYRRNAVLIALFLTLPVLAIRLPELMNASRGPGLFLLSAWEIGTFVILLVAATRLVLGRLARTGT